MLEISPEDFEARNLEDSYKSDKRYDIAMSTECAEHLSPSRADGFVQDLIELSDLILFSAAVPYQGGAGHINEQPLSYWVKKFEACGYELRDIIRPDIWDDKKVATCYRQNVVLFVKMGSKVDDLLDKNARNRLLDVIHPDHWNGKNRMLEGRLGRIYMWLERRMINLRSHLNK